GDGEKGGPVEMVERSGVELRGECHVVDRVQLQLSGGGFDQHSAASLPLVHRPGDRLQRGPDRQRPGAILDEDVAARQRQAVLFAHDRAADHLAGERQVSVHAADDHQLLMILAPEEGPVGLKAGEQLGDDRGHSVEAAGTVEPFRLVGDEGYADGGQWLGRIHLLEGRGEEDVDALRFGQGGVPVRSRGYRSRSAGSSNWSGLTNSDMTTTSHIRRAASANDRWPSWR